MRVVAALGGNALLRRGEPAEPEVQQKNVGVAVRALAELALEHELVVTHGNGPQVGMLALQAPTWPLDVLGAESEAMIGYLVEQGLENALPERQMATLITQVVVDGADPAFDHPTKPIGPVYTKVEAERLASEKGWSIAADGKHWRRVVASPQPQDIVEIEAIRLLVDAGVLVICTGGGGIPVTKNGTITGVEAVIDKDRAGALLAEELDADFLLMLTDVPCVELDWGTPDARPLSRVTPEELRQHTWANGSMGPKVEAACRFVERTGGTAAIGALADAAAIVRGEAGTLIARS